MKKMQPSSRQSPKSTTPDFYDYLPAVAETWRRVWGGRKNFSQTKISELGFFRKNFHFQAQNF